MSLFECLSSGTNDILIESYYCIGSAAGTFDLSKVTNHGEFTLTHLTGTGTSAVIHVDEECYMFDKVYNTGSATPTPTLVSAGTTYNYGGSHQYVFYK